MRGTGVGLFAGKILAKGNRARCHTHDELGAGYEEVSARSTGGSSAVEQWTVKCALCAEIHWSGVQISLPGKKII